MGLVLTIKPGMKINIGDNIEIEIIKIGRREGTIVINADKSIPICRNNMKCKEKTELKEEIK